MQAPNPPPPPPQGGDKRRVMRRQKLRHMTNGKIYGKRYKRKTARDDYS